jgi:hypothetical protein
MATEDTRPPGNLSQIRRFTRFPVSLPVTGRVVELSEGDIEGMARNVGAGGLMAELPVSLPPGSAVGLVLQRRHGPLLVEARVIWTMASGGMIRHGFAFLEPKWPGFAMDLFLDENR